MKLVCWQLLSLLLLLSYSPSGDEKTQHENEETDAKSDAKQIKNKCKNRCNENKKADLKLLA